jgi:N-acetylmuramoyl-L-alanine amidase
VTLAPASFAPDSRYVGQVYPAANVEPRRNGQTTNMLLLHYTGMRSAAAAIEWLARTDSRVSCHYVIDVDGRITQQVPEALRAWHAGLSFWAGETDINSCSVGIEVQNPGHQMGYHDFPLPQLQAVATLSRDICQRHGITPQRVLAHSDVAPLRKIDPGEKFDWGFLARQGVGAWSVPSPVNADDTGVTRETAPAAIRAAQVLFRRYGYDMDITGALDQKTVAVIAAFQRHFRPARVDGALDLSTLATLERLIGHTTPVTERSVEVA